MSPWFIPENMAALGIIYLILVGGYLAGRVFGYRIHNYHSFAISGNFGKPTGFLLLVVLPFTVFTGLGDVGGGFGSWETTVLVYLGSMVHILGFIVFAIRLGNADALLRMWRAETRDTGSVSDGPTIVSGTVEPRDDPYTAPVSGRDAIGLVYSVDEWVKAEEKRVETTIASGSFLTKFTVDDGTGRVTVDPGDTTADTFYETETEVTVSGDEEPPDVIQNYLQLDSSPDPTTNLRTYRESRLEPGDEAAVVGNATTDADEARIEPSNLGGIIVGATEMDAPRGFTKKLRRKILLEGPIALVLSAVGWVGMAMAQGVI